MICIITFALCGNITDALYSYIKIKPDNIASTRTYFASTHIIVQNQRFVLSVFLLLYFAGILLMYFVIMSKSTCNIAVIIMSKST